MPNLQQEATCGSVQGRGDLSDVAQGAGIIRYMGANNVERKTA